MSANRCAREGFALIYGKLFYIEFGEHFHGLVEVVFWREGHYRFDF